MARRRIVVSGGDDPDLARTVAHERRDRGDEVVLLNGRLDVDQLGNTVIAEDAVEVVVVGSEDFADMLRVWLDEHGGKRVEVDCISE